MSSFSALFQAIYASIQAPFNITDKLDGSATSYTITYTDSTFSYICGSTVISASTCESGICSDWFDIASSPCAQSTNVTVTAFATNLLGDGSPSQPIQIVLLSDNGTRIRAAFRISFKGGRGGFSSVPGQVKIM